MSRTLTPEEAQVLQALDEGRRVTVADLANELGIDQAKISAAAIGLGGDELIRVEEEEYAEWVLKEEAAGALKSGTPERRILLALLDHNGSGSMAEVPGWAGLEPKVVGQSLRGLADRGWVEKKGKDLEVTDQGRAERDVKGPDEQLIELLDRLGGAALESSIVLTDGGEAGIAPDDLERAKALIGKKSPFVERKTRVHRWLSATDAGAKLRAKGVEATREVSQLTPELLSSGEWRNVKFKPYDINLDTEPFQVGKRHPLQRVIESTRQVFIEMGFEEAVSPYVESGFWDFDALFQPQDHPAREMQDTFYMESPSRTELPDAGLVDAVRATHETGGDTGSVGWRYKWDTEKARQTVLRTHTTATTIRELAKNPNGPRKIFSIGRVFRRETIDYKHLPIFFQVDGIIIDKTASFSSLLGTLAAFYERMGFEKFTFRPGFFPYTEPSVEVFIWHEEKQDWFEMGGSGIFRPEVTEPLGCTEPVLAWGLGLDRLAMLLHDRSDIRDLYISDLEWLRTEPRCR